jgi:hypothetical protein
MLDVILNAVHQLDIEAAARQRGGDLKGADRLRKIAAPLRALLVPEGVAVAEDDGEPD